MLVNDIEISKRLSNPLNLMNRLNSIKNSRKNAMSLFIPEKSSLDKKPFINPFKNDEITATKQSEPGVVGESLKVTSIEVLPPAGTNPTIDELIESADDKIGLATAHDESLKLLNSAISTMKLKIGDIKPEKLPAVIMATSKVVESIRRERLERERSDHDDSIHFHFYVPKQKSIEAYDVVNVAT